MSGETERKFMKKQRYGFTLVELLVVIAIIGVLAGILVPSLSAASVRAQRAKVKAIITQLEQALTQYKLEKNKYPPSTENNGGSVTSGGTYTYRNDCLVKYLDGDTSNGGESILYFDFQIQYLRPSNNLIYYGPFDEDFWYHNFDEDNATSRVRSTSYPLHPWYNRINFQGVQIYSRANGGKDYGNDAYGGATNPTTMDFLWITNYTK